MREIKFRAWDKQEQKMYPVVGIYYSIIRLYIETVKLQIEKCDITLFDKILDKDIGELELMQYTGLKDCTGREIFEGDILSYQEEHYIAKFGIDDNDDCQWSGVYFEDKDVIYRGLNARLLTVIGNIYEHPELLEGNMP